MDPLLDGSRSRLENPPRIPTVWVESTGRRLYRQPFNTYMSR